MVRLIQFHGTDHGFDSSIPLAIGLFVSVSALVALCAKRARRRTVSKSFENSSSSSSNDTFSSNIPPKSPARQLLTNISNKALPFIYGNKKNCEEDEEGFGDGGLWQRSILMGEKCQPPEFSGVIYYDIDGKRLPELPPRSPRASPLPASFSFPVATEGRF